MNYSANRICSSADNQAFVTLFLLDITASISYVFRTVTVVKPT